MSFAQAALPHPAHSRPESSVVMADACALPALCDGAPCTWGAATRWTCAVGRPVVLPPWARWPRGSLGRCFFLPSPKRRCVHGAVASYVRHRAEVVPEADIVNAEFVTLLPPTRTPPSGMSSMFWTRELFGSLVDMLGTDGNRPPGYVYRFGGFGAHPPPCKLLIPRHDGVTINVLQLPPHRRDWKPDKLGLGVPRHTGDIGKKTCLVLGRQPFKALLIEARKHGLGGWDVRHK